MGLPPEFQTSDRVPLAAVRRAVEQGDLAVRRAALCFVRDHGCRILPSPSDEWLRDELYRYYLDCIRQGVKDGSTVDSPCEAAAGLVHLFEWLVAGNADGAAAAERMAVAMMDFCREEQVWQDCVAMGFLEHVLEAPAHVKYVELWEKDPHLAARYRAALAWGKAHSRPHG